MDRVIDAVKADEEREYQSSCNRKFCRAMGQSKSQYAVPVEADRANLTAVDEKPSKGNSAAVVVVVTVTPPVGHIIDSLLVGNIEEVFRYLRNGFRLYEQL
jgi:hypothetical protein